MLLYNILRNNPNYLFSSYPQIFGSGAPKGSIAFLQGYSLFIIKTKAIDFFG